MAVVRVVQMTVDQVVDVVAVWNRLVSAPGSVHVTGVVGCAVVVGRAALGVGAVHGDRVLVDMTGVLVVEVAVVQVVDMVLVPHRGMPAARLVGVVVVGVERAFVVAHTLTVLRPYDRRRSQPSWRGEQCPTEGTSSTRSGSTAASRS
jgi:hypothetical protein